jgi:N utilization substance protein B
MFRIKYSREVALKLLYQIDILKLDRENLAGLLKKNSNFFKGLNSTEEEFVLKIISYVTEKKEMIDELISKRLIRWKLKRLMSIDRNLLRMGIAESFFNDQKAVIIDDIVRIAKKYGGEDSYKIINAILDKVIV